MPNEPKRFHAYLLRLWPEHDGTEGAPGRRASLEDPRSGERLSFASLDQLFTHLMRLAETNGQVPGEGADGHS